MSDMLVKLYDLPDSQDLIKKLEAQNIQIRRALAPDKARILRFISEEGIGNPRTEAEADVCFANTPVSLFVATEGSKLIGYACYNAIAPDFFGPTAVDPAYRGKGIGSALCLKALEALYNEGYQYAIIGGIGPRKFYEKVCNALLIPDSSPGVYKDFLYALEREEEDNTVI